MHMHQGITTEIAALRIAEWHQQAARQRVAPKFPVARAASSGTGRVQAQWIRLSLRRPRPASA